MQTSPMVRRPCTGRPRTGVPGLWGYHRLLGAGSGATGSPGYGRRPRRSRRRRGPRKRRPRASASARVSLTTATGGAAHPGASSASWGSDGPSPTCPAQGAGQHPPRSRQRAVSADARSPRPGSSSNGRRPAGLPAGSPHPPARCGFARDAPLAGPGASQARRSAPRVGAPSSRLHRRPVESRRTRMSDRGLTGGSPAAMVPAFFVVGLLWIPGV